MEDNFTIALGVIAIVILSAVAVLFICFAAMAVKDTFLS